MSYARVGNKTVYQRRPARKKTKSRRLVVRRRHNR
jgi:hypothetical protein